MPCRRRLPYRLSQMAQQVAGGSDRAQVRLAELVAALSLGIDLGFGQPMEHVLRQCLIALRLAEGLGLDEEQRAVVYYTALLVNVGCHTDAHEQAKWFGDDIALKSVKYDHEPRSLRMATTGMRQLGAGHAAAAPVPARPRLRALGAPRGRRDDRPPRRDRPHDGGAALAAGRGRRGDRFGVRALGWPRLARRARGRRRPARVPGRSRGRVRRGREPHSGAWTPPGSSPGSGVVGTSTRCSPG